MSLINIICVECPIGCALSVTMQDGKVTEVCGNTCPRGKAYAESEVVCPKRILTTTVKSSDGRILSVKTDNPVPKSQMMELMQVINKITVNSPVKIGDVVKKDLIQGVDLVATDYLE